MWSVAIAEILEVCLEYWLYDRFDCLLYNLILDRWYAKRTRLSVFLLYEHPPDIAYIVGLIDEFPLEFDEKLICPVCHDILYCVLVDACGSYLAFW